MITCCFMCSGITSVYIFVIIIFNYGETGKRFSRWSRACDIVFKRNNSDSGKLFLKDGTLYLLPVLSVWWWDGERKRQIQERQVRTSKAVTGAVLRRSKDFVSYSIHKIHENRYLIVFKHKMHTPISFFYKTQNKMGFSPVVQMFIWVHYLLIHIEIAGLRWAFCSCFVRVISTFGWEAQRPVELASMLDTYFLHFMEGNWGMEKLSNLAKLTWLRREKIKFWTQTA